MTKPEWHIYIGKIPFAERSNFWVSFESDNKLTKTKSNIYNRCLPCIKNLYEQLKHGCPSITLGTAYTCWKITAVLKGLEECQSLLHEFEIRFPGKYVYGKFGSGKPNAKTRVVVFHAESIEERDWLESALVECLPVVDKWADILISRACEVLYAELLGDWRNWQPETPIKNPAIVDKLLERIKAILNMSAM
ncbi:conserved hypothetical protein [uncultured Desulfobacterium sp.]|uniref:Uncharacterized protein n=1 Tax=uncultured Desulfobacterium sp. TaxID=201089 RepID=A0A445MX98_9BACT|nr:conserved hypothetical protein [uncultured Desulfobacterium sp.]